MSRRSCAECGVALVLIGPLQNGIAFDGQVFEHCFTEQIEEVCLIAGTHRRDKTQELALLLGDFVATFDAMLVLGSPYLYTTTAAGNKTQANIVSCSSGGV